MVLDSLLFNINFVGVTFLDDGKIFSSSKLRYRYFNSYCHKSAEYSYWVAIRTSDTNHKHTEETYSQTNIYNTSSLTIIIEQTNTHIGFSGVQSQPTETMPTDVMVYIHCTQLVTIT